MTFSYLFTTFLLFAAGLAENKSPFKLSLERSIIKYKDPGYIGNISTNVAKENRNSPYVWNLNLILLRSWDGNVSIELKTYELRNNQYRESIIRAEFDFCFTIAHDHWLYPAIRKFSNLSKKCPIKAGSYSIKNFLLPEDKFPANFPEGRWRFDFKFFVTQSRKYILKVQLFFKVEKLIARQKSNKKKSSKES